jgi:hypothetical protein
MRGCVGKATRLVVYYTGETLQGWGSYERLRQGGHQVEFHAMSVAIRLRLQVQ